MSKALLLSLARALRAAATYLEADAESCTDPARDGADDFVTAQTSGIGVRTFRRAAREGAFPIFKVRGGREWLARKSDVAAYVRANPVRVDVRKTESGEQPDALDEAIREGRLRVVGKGSR